MLFWVVAKPWSSELVAKVSNLLAIRPLLVEGLSSAIFTAKPFTNESDKTEDKTVEEHCINAAFIHREV
jgi:hypothetical protein